MAGFSGSFPHDLLDLNDWRWQGPVKENGALGDEGDRKAVSVPSDEADISRIEQYRDDPWFVLVTDGDAGPYVRLRSPAKGSTTSSGSSATTRSELREMHHPDGDRKSAWDAGGSTVHNLKVRLAVTKVMEKNGKRSRVAVAQVHKTTEDGILVYLDGESGKLRWKQDSEVQSSPLGDYTLGQYVNIGLSVRDGRCTIYVDDVEKAEGKLTGSSAKTSYFKTGCYNQDNSRADGYPDDAFNEVRIAAVRVQHGAPWAPGGYEPVGPGVGATEGGEPKEPQEPQIGATGSKPRDLIQFNGPKQAWKLNLDINDAGKHTGKKGGSVEKSAKALVDGFVHEGHFDVVDDGRAVRFRSHLNGATTGGSSYPRTELREMKPGDPTKKAEWNPADGSVRRLTAQVKVTHAPSTPSHKRVSIGQIHGGDDDLLQIMYDAEKKAIGYTWPDDGEGRWKKNLIQDYTLGTWFTYRIEAGGGTVRIFIDGQEKAVEQNVDSPKCYFKAGAYTQSSVIKQPDTADPNDFGEAVFRSIVIGS
jgi:poly(beta-D-mannuronate) lyase